VLRWKEMREKCRCRSGVFAESEGRLYLPLYRCYRVSITVRTSARRVMLVIEGPRSKGLNCSVLSEEMLVYNEAFNRR
jgi:hypothetical protein